MPLVKDVMTKKVVTFSPETTIREVCEALSKHNISGAPVINNKREVIGLISESDIIQLGEKSATLARLGHYLPLEISLNINQFELKQILNAVKNAGGKKAAEVMTKRPITISPDAGIVEAADIMKKKNVNRLPVVDNKNKLVGIVSRQDIIRGFYLQFATKEK